jgi:diguanylate cyclase (GGDEF)-like protein
MLTINTSVTVDILVIIPLIFTIYLVRKNEVTSHKKTNYYVLSAVLTLVALVLEIATEVFQTIPNPTLVPFHIAANVIGFSIMPVVALSLAYLHNGKLIKYKGSLCIPLLINTFIIFCSAKTGWIFSVSAVNVYARGEYFWFQAACCLLYFLILAASDLYIFHKNSREEKLLQCSIYFLPVVGTTIQLLFPDLLLIWGSVSISLLLYYIFLRELQFKYDSLTGIQNRAAFIKEMKACNRIPEAVVAVFDLNDLKKINDMKGHAEGDKAIREASNIIKDCFSQYGTPFRIGGDEFCVICKSISETALEQCLERLKRRTDEHNQNTTDKLHIAYGYSFLDLKNMTNIYEAFAVADQHMYENKSLLKASMQ